MTIVDSTVNAGDIDVYGRKSQGPAIGAIILTVALFPLFLVGFLITWLMFMIARQRPAVIAQLSALITIIVIITSDILTIHTWILESLSSIVSAVFSANWNELFWAYISTWSIGLVAGLWAGTIYFAFKTTRMFPDEVKKHFKPSPWRMIASRRNEKLLMSGAVKPLSSVELGLNSNGDISMVKYEKYNHCLIIGTTGSGKTVAIQKHVESLLRNNRSVILIDLKGSHELAAFVSYMANKHDRVFHHYDSESPSVPYAGYSPLGRACYNPLSRGSYDHLSDVVISMAGKTEGDGKVYRDVGHSYLKTMFHVMELVGADMSRPLTTASDLLNPDRLSELAQKLPNTPEGNSLRSDVQKLRESKRDRLQEGARSGLSAPLSKLHKSIDGNYLLTPKEGDNRDYIDLENVARNGEIALFSINASTRPETAAFIANYIVEDIKELASQLDKDKAGNDVFVIFDEFSAFEGDSIINLLNKCRSAGIRVILSAQTSDDMRAQDSVFLSRVMANVDTTLVMRVPQISEAQMFAESFGKKTEMKMTRGYRQKKSLFSTAEASFVGDIKGVTEEVYVVEPSDIQTLPTGTAYLRVSSEGRLERVCIIADFPFGQHFYEEERAKRNSAQAPAITEPEPVVSAAREGVGIDFGDEYLSEAIASYRNSPEGRVPSHWAPDMRVTGEFSSLAAGVDRGPVADVYVDGDMPDSLFDDGDTVVDTLDADEDIAGSNGLSGNALW